MMGADLIAELPPLGQPVEIVVVDVGGLRCGDGVDAVLGRYDFLKPGLLPQ